MDPLQVLKLLSHPVVAPSSFGRSCNVVWVDRDAHPIYFKLLLFSGQTKDIDTILKVVETNHNIAWVVALPWRWL